MTRRVSFEQRQRLLSFMQAHEDLAGGRVSGVEATRQKKIHLDEMTEELNSLGSGATKTPEKWIKCWQDWRSDVKAKYVKIKKAEATGGPSAVPLTPLEEELLQFMGVEVDSSLLAAADPLESSEAAPSSPSIKMEVSAEEMAHETVETDFEYEDPHQRRNTRSSGPKRRDAQITANGARQRRVVASARNTRLRDPTPPRDSRRPPDDPVNSLLERQAVAIEVVAAGMHEIAAALRQIAAALQKTQR